MSNIDELTGMRGKTYFSISRDVYSSVQELNWSFCVFSFIVRISWWWGWLLLIRQIVAQKIPPTESIFLTMLLSCHPSLPSSFFEIILLIYLLYLPPFKYKHHESRDSFSLIHCSKPSPWSSVPYIECTKYLSKEYIS